MGRMFNPPHPGESIREDILPALDLSVTEAAKPIVHAASDEGVSGGDAYGPTGFLETRGRTGRARINPVAKDIELARRLWSLSEELTGIRYLSSL